MRLLLDLGCLAFAALCLGFALRTRRQAERDFLALEEKYTRIVSTPAHRDGTAIPRGLGTSRVGTSRIRRKVWKVGE